VLNFSTLHGHAFVMDTHVLRVFRRLGLIGRKEKSAGPACDLVMPALEDWSSLELAELHVLVKSFGQDCCHAHRPACARCILRDMCRNGPDY